jgi:Mg/Co/Ni transporter MgtE
MIKDFIEGVRDGVELLLLWRIWVDGRAIRAIEKASHDLYIKYFAERQEERKAKLLQLAKAREAKALKKIDPVDASVEALKELTQRNLIKKQTGDLE